jgi:hypothetical protein
MVRKPPPPTHTSGLGQHVAKLRTRQNPPSHTPQASVNTLLNYALDNILPEFGTDLDVVPYGLANTTATLLSGAHRMGRVGFDYEAR